VREAAVEISKRCTFDCARSIDTIFRQVTLRPAPVSLSLCSLSLSLLLYLSAPPTVLLSRPTLQRPQLIPHLVNPVITVPWRVIGAIVQAESPFRDRLL